MVKEFKFFHGVTLESNEIQGMVRRLRAHWRPEPMEEVIDAEQELTRIMSEEIARGIDEDILRTITRRVNGDDNNNYLNRWLSIGNNIA
jgi:hypothetical protein